MTEQSRIESTINMIAGELHAKGKPFPKTIPEIPDFPLASYDQLLQAFRQRTLLLQRFSVHYDNNIYNLFASRFEQNLNNLYLILAFLLPLASIVLAFVYSWWWLLGILGLFFALGRSKKLYNAVVLSSAFASELNFCFLYATGQVCVTTSDYNKSYYWKSD